MAFPTIPTVAAGRVLWTLNTNPAGTHTSPNLSSLTKASGDLLLAVLIIYNGTTTDAEFSAWGGGFTELKDDTNVGTMAMGSAYKWSDGTETGTFTVTTPSASTDSAFLLMAIPGAHASTIPAFSAMATGTSAAANPAALDPAAWGAEDTLWIAVAGCGETSTTGSFTGVTAAPTNYGDYSDSGISADVVGGVEGAVAFRQVNTSSEDVPAFTVDTSNARNAAMVFAIRPAAPVDADAEVAWSELEVPNASSDAEISWAELEVPTASSQAEISWAEFEVPTASSQAEVAWSELEVPDLAVNSDGEIAWAEFEVPDLVVDANAEIAWAEFEVPLADADLEISFAEFEVPLASSQAEISWVEFEVPTASAQAEISWAEFEVPTASSQAEIAWADMEFPDLAGGGGDYMDDKYIIHHSR